MDIELEKKREAAYWRERFNIINDANSKMSQQTYNEVAHAFDLAQKDIQRDIDAWMNRFASNNGITLADAKKLLNSQELKEFKWDVWEYIKHGKQNAISGKWAKELENASAKYHISRLEALKMRIQNHFETAFAVENKAVDKLVKDVYKTGYYRTAFEFQKGSGIGFDVIGLDEKRLDTIAHKPWTTDRRTFSDRIWERKDQMVNNFHQNMIRNCAAGRSRKEMVKDLEQFVNKNVKNAKYCAARVVRTETAAFSSQSQYESLLNIGCERYEISLPLTAASCPICQEMNGKSFKTSEYEVGATAPPFHPNCDNGTLIPIYDDDFFKDDPPEGAEEIPDNISYEEWEKKFVKDKPGDIDFMASNFKPKFSNREVDFTVGEKTVKVKAVENSKFDLYADADYSRRNKAVRLAERQLKEVSPMLPDDFKLPTTAVVDFEKFGISSTAIAGFERNTGIMYLNSKYDTIGKILDYVNKSAGQFANKTELAPILHELGHNFYENSVKALAKSKGLEYNRAKEIIDGRIYDYIHERNVDGRFILENLSRYADDGYSKHNYTEIIAECFSVQSDNPIAMEILTLLGDDILDDTIYGRTD